MHTNDDLILDTLSRPILLYVTKDGTLTYRYKHIRTRLKDDVGLPVFSVCTEEEAQAIQLHFCRRQYQPYPGTFEQPWYKLSRLDDGSDLAGGNLQIAHLDGITRMFRAFHQERGMIVDARAVRP